MPDPSTPSSAAFEKLGLFYLGYPSGEWPKGYRKPLPDFVRYVEG